MGARCVPSYAKLFMGWWEETHTNVFHWFCYIDDLLFLWAGSESECMTFISELNNNTLNITLTALFSTSMVDFLDLKIMKNGTQIQTKLFRKTTATNSLLHFMSFHPQHLRNNLPKGQFLRVRHNCSADADFREDVLDLMTRLAKRGYPGRVTSRAFQHSASNKKRTLLQPKIWDQPCTTNLVTVYNNQWHHVQDVLNRYWCILLSDPKLRPFISDTPKIVARKAKNLKDHLTTSHFKRPTTKLCTETIKTKIYSNCRSRNVTYLLICPCPGIYVGQTSQEVRRSIQQHISNIGKAKGDFEKGIVDIWISIHGYLDIYKFIPLAWTPVAMKTMSKSECAV
ncbi:unnamed protein product, partial [Ranitomeya imitator]